jgi:deoxyribodipyrimidine photolyase-related protein
MPEKQKQQMIGIIFPHQLFQNNPVLEHTSQVYLVEETLFFNQYNFHKQKLAFQRASMQYYRQYLQSQNIKVSFIQAQDKDADIRELLRTIKDQGHKKIVMVDPTDNWLQRRTQARCHSLGLEISTLPSPLFINSSQEISEYFKDKKRMFQTDFYKWQRKHRDLMMDGPNQPQGGKWSYDDENRLKYPKGQQAPQTHFPKPNTFWDEAINYVNTHFPHNYGQLNTQFAYPCTHQQAEQWMQDFFTQRFKEFGPYEDAIVPGENIINHSLLSPLINTGLLCPKHVVSSAIQYASSHAIPLNSLEGFVRQILGWREFIRAVYELKGTQQRQGNFWGFSRKIPQSFWNATTGIEPIDSTIKMVLQTGYCHHIERLMLLGNFMLLCEFDPKEVYKWFMELFIDSYDWVMVPNVYGMSQFADGGIFATKPYISGSSYVLKMSHYKKGEWQATWDGLFWRFMHHNRSFFLSNPRLGMLISTYDKMATEKQELHLSNAQTFIDMLDKQLS